MGDMPARSARLPAGADSAEPGAAGGAATRCPEEVIASARGGAGAVGDEQRHLAVDSGFMCLWDFDVATGVVHRWGNYVRLLGAGGGVDVAGRATYPDYVDSADVARQEAAIQRSLSTGSNHDCEYRLVRPDGQVRWLRQRGQVIKGSSGAVERIVGVTLDITGQRRAEQRLAETFERISDGFLTLDSRCHVTYANVNATRLLGCSPDAMIGRPLGEAVAVLGAEFARACQQALRNGQADCAEYPVSSLRRWLEARVYRDPEGLSVYLRDVTERRAAEEERLAAAASQAQEAQRAARLAEVTAALDRLSEVERREHAFVDIAATIAGAGSLDRTLDATARAVVEATSMGACAIILFEGEPPCARVAGTFGLPSSYRREYAAAVRSGRRLPSVEAFRTGRAVVVPDIQNDLSLDGLTDRAWQSLVCLPLIVRGTPVGTLKMLYPADREPDDVDVAFLQAVADQAATAVDSARLYAETAEAASMQERHRLAQELHDSVTQSLFSMTLLARASGLKLRRLQYETTGVSDAATLDDLLAVLLPRIQRLSGADAVRVLVLDEAAQELIRVGSGGLQTNVGEVVRVPVGEGFAGRVAADCQPVVVNDVSRAEPFWRPRRTGIGSLAGVPLMNAGQLVGVLMIGSRHANAYATDATNPLGLLQRIGEQIAAAITADDHLRSSTVAHQHSQLDAVPRTAGEGVGQLREMLTDMENMSSAALAEMRALLFELRPQALGGKNLIGALQEQAETLRTRFSLQVDVHTSGRVRLEPAVEEELFRISVEALANVVRHSSAGHAQVSLSRDGDECVLLIADDGIGFDVTEPRPGHLGLATMSERAHRIGAQFDLASSPGQGTRVAVTLPLPSPITTVPRSVA